MVVLLAGCAGSSEYVCPDPVGKIIKDDCEVYRTRYEALKVELGASFAGLAEVKTSLTKTSLRDPSELIQVLAHRTHALCKDFNACRVPPLEYRQRREQTDRVFTAVSTIQEQLKVQLDVESKAKLVRELVRVLGEDTGTSVSASPGAAVGPRGATPRAGSPRRPGLYRSWVPWYGTSLLPPQPPGPKGFPVLAGVHFDLEHVFHRDGNRGVSGFRPQATLFLLGAVEADDVVTVDWGGRSSDCPIGHGEENGLARVRCAPPKAFSLTGSSFTIKATYRRGGDGKAALIGQRTVPVLSRHPEDTVPGNLTYAIDRDPLVGEGRLVFRPHDGLPAELERPSLLVVLKIRKHMDATARCWVDGKVATSGLKTGRGGGQVGWFQDRPRYRSVRPGVSEAVKDPNLEWWRYDFPLPFVVKRGGTPVPEGMKLWPLAGTWRCVVSVEGEPVRELGFRVGRDGRLAAHPRQREQPEAAWLLETKVLPNPFEDPVR